ncbi:stage II sporulation protein P [Paenibacillus paeoniae]|uniref:Stage II sporulation protein P n=2 Tax=Paenibacillus paeoniae TaxID=2292705 RepID=A0A371PP15_9BACL|nr:stage II sporulation protein P [Paenibacillus paeoniae]REK77934.1 stage II sporulation protein P [Paenibacillus paeoniae]
MNSRPAWLNTMRDGTKVKHLLMTGRAFSLLSLSSMIFFIVLGAAGSLHQQSTSLPIHSMRGFSAAVSSGFFGDMLQMEMPSFHSGLESESFTNKEISTFLIRTLTSINPNDPSGLLSAELPGMQNDSFLIRKGVGTDTNNGPQDHLPITHPPSGAHEDDDLPYATDGPDREETTPQPEQSTQPTPPAPSDKPDTGKSKVAFIYHTHNRESWLPELDKESKDASSTTKNITLVGKRLAEKLEDEGIGAMHSDTDYPSTIKDFNYAYSYKYSKKTVKEAMASTSDLKLFFDLHRDSQKRKYTTIEIDGESYAQVYFVIGNKNPAWKENEAFATKIHNALEKKYPGISRGIWGKTTGNAEYNQSLAPESALIEIGGIENTLEECYRTADALAEVISSIYWEAEKVSGKE